MMTRAFLLSAALAGSTVVTAAAAETVDFAKQIQPIFDEHCAKCHGADKALGKLRLNTPAGIVEKLAAKPQLLVAGKPEESELYKRLTLPEDNPKRMPKMADPLPKETIELIANWIKEGAVLPAAVAEPTPPEKPAEKPADKPVEKPAENAAEKPAESPAADKSKEVDPAKLPDVPPAPAEAVNRLTAANAQVTPLFGGSSLLTVSFARRDQPASDAELALLADVATQVYSLDLSGAKLSDAGVAQLAKLNNLTALHLELSSVTDAGLAHVAGLGSLRYLNLYGTGITDEGLKHLAGLRHLQKLYLWQTKASYEAATALEKGTPGLIVNLGYNHPAVAKARLTKEIEVAKKQAEDAKAESAKVEQQLEAAKKNLEATNARVAEIEKELKALEPPAESAEAKPEEKKPEEKADEKKPEEKKSEEKTG